MIGLDTNAIVRLVVQDDAEQTQIVAEWLKYNSKMLGPVFISDLVLAETVWVLKQAYSFSREEIAETLLQFFLNTVFAFERDDASMFKALQQYADGRVDLSDILISQKAREWGCAATLSFDKTAIREGLMDELTHPT